MGGFGQSGADRLQRGQRRGGRGAPRAGTVQGGDRRPLPALRPCGPEGGPDRPGGAGGAAGQQGGSGGPERRGAPPVSRGGLHAPHRLRQLHRKRDQRPGVPCLPRLFLPAPAFGGAPLWLLRRPLRPAPPPGRHPGRRPGAHRLLCQCHLVGKSGFLVHLKGQPLHPDEF